MNSKLSFDSAADSKNFITDAYKVIRDPITGKILQAACGVASIATAVSVGGAAPVAGVVCGAAAIQGAISR
jgi:hypothetical protein